MRQELALSVLVFLLLFIKIGKERGNTSILNFVNIALFINLIIGICFVGKGELFSGMFATNALIILEKNITDLTLFL